MGGRKAGPGRPKGTPNKRTVQKLLEASNDLAAIERLGQKKATAVLNELMQTSLNLAQDYHKKILLKNPMSSDFEHFWKAMDSAGVFAKALAPYQQPQFKSVAISLGTPGIPDPAESAKEVKGKVIKMDDPNAVARIYQQTVKRIA